MCLQLKSPAMSALSVLDSTLSKSESCSSAGGGQVARCDVERFVFQGNLYCTGFKGFVGLCELNMLVGNGFFNKDSCATL